MLGLNLGPPTQVRQVLYHWGFYQEDSKLLTPQGIQFHEKGTIFPVFVLFCFKTRTCYAKQKELRAQFIDALASVTDKCHFSFVAARFLDLWKQRIFQSQRRCSVLLLQAMQELGNFPLRLRFVTKVSVLENNCRGLTGHIYLFLQSGVRWSTLKFVTQNLQLLSVKLGLIGGD